MKCPKCNTDNPDTQRVCGECATPLQPSKDIGVTKTIETPVEEFTRGTTFADRYEIIEELGKGGMGTVYRVEDTKIGQDIALKLIKPEIASDKKTIERFRNELKTTRMISHRNVCRMFDLSDAEGTHFITMEYILGEDLRSFIRRVGQLPSEKAISIAKQVCEGLVEAHRLGVVHRDLKSSNIMIDKEGNARIMDFGIAMSHRTKGLTGEGIIIGTAEYMSPEQAEAKEIDHRSDIYSLGVILYEMVTRQLPFEGDTALSIAMKHKSEVPKDPKEYNAHIPDDLSRLILRCLEKERESRYQSTEELISELDKIGKGIPTTERTAVKKKLEAGPIIEKSWESSIAVLPFTNMSADPEQEYFCDGMAEEIINALTHVESLRIVARTSAFAFKGKSVNVREIGKELNVKFVLEGSVRKAGNRLRITAQLINVADGYHLWSERFDRKLADVFDIQDEISLAITDNLKLKLLGKERERIAKRYTDRVEAYQLYMKGRYHWNKWTDEGYRRSIEYYQRALQVDLKYALAYAGLADAYSSLTSTEIVGLSPKVQMSKAKEMALKALELDDKLPEAYTSIAEIKLSYEYEWIDAEQAFLHALDLNPGSAHTNHRYSHLLVALGRMNESLAISERVLELNPIDVEMGVHMAWHYYNARQYDEAIKTCEKTIEIEPNFHETHWFMGLALEGKNLFNDAIVALQKAITLSKGSTIERAALGHVYGRAGMRNKAEQVLEELSALSKERHVSSANFAMVNAGLGKKDEVVEFLEKGYRERASWMPYIGIDPRFEYLRSNVRFQNLLMKMKLSE